LFIFIEKREFILKQFIHTKFKAWFGGRMPIADQVLLNQRSTYIMPTRAGYLAMVVSLLMMVGATNYQNNLAFLLTFLLAGIGLVCIVFTFKNLQGVQFSLGHTSECFAGAPISVIIRIKSQTGQQHFSIAIGLNKNELYFTNVTYNHDAEIRLSIAETKRGYWQLPRLIAFSQFPFGWFQTWAYFQFKTPILVYPKAVEPPSYYEQQGEGDENEEGEKAKGNEDLFGLKPYQQGESLNRVDWKSYARERGMYVREFASFQTQQLCFSWHDYPNCDNELRLSYLTHMVVEASSRNLCYSLELPNNSIENDEGEIHRRKCLEMLALFNCENV
jgi:uncharacterized protein (DUF58 family)